MVEKELTRAEEQIMHVLWGLEKGFVKDVLDRLPEPKPAYNTVSTIIRILEQKGFVGHTAYGKSHQYHPLITKEQYRTFATEKLMEGYFGNSVGSLFSFFMKKKKVELNEADDILKMIEQMKKE
ncbi:BlaI/MecI/CopY family transcriptional regulator [Siphonobacter aquaeclarae]|jgi:BlaI family penicillinase repressor|uniref:Predicted transcriptional regulator n=1 Tax=Siphonobacter aquaeclarae TaxID=563176 RepID=A0A1G9NLV8_9BACT|nr:BlaI/MecI/CopY family transcriptional regulator [Siphonobacter aquaeclarae]MBO9636639.1 BlaI/MecI/CopY family transcriptional regulator [Siphonobacter aquaeclarae]SDL86965.1 Predicted transcriptional regulator [Siphonobacter aquaeclarae]